MWCCRNICLSGWSEKLLDHMKCLLDPIPSLFVDSSVLLSYVFAQNKLFGRFSEFLGNRTELGGILALGSPGDSSAVD